jgi:hypothetical protein
MIPGHALFDPIHLASISNSSPYVYSASEFRCAFGNGGRREALIRELDIVLEGHLGGGVNCVAMLVGGSFLDLTRDPRDLDALLIYTLSGGTEPELEANTVRRIHASRGNGLDLRYCPVDAGPIILIKAVCFFHSLYMHDRESGFANKPSILVDLAV